MNTDAATNGRFFCQHVKFSSGSVGTGSSRSSISKDFARLIATVSMLSDHDNEVRNGRVVLRSGLPLVSGTRLH